MSGEIPVRFLHCTRVERHAARLVTWLALGIAIVAYSSTDAAAQGIVTTCGTVIASPGTHVLQNDLLNCPGDGITVVTSNVVLNLNGHQISGPGINADAAGVFVGRGVASGVSNVSVLGPATILNFQSGVTFEGVSNSDPYRKGLHKRGYPCLSH